MNNRFYQQNQTIPAYLLFKQIWMPQNANMPMTFCWLELGKRFSRGLTYNEIAKNPITSFFQFPQNKESPCLAAWCFTNSIHADWENSQAWTQLGLIIFLHAEIELHDFPEDILEYILVCLRNDPLLHFHSAQKCFEIADALNPEDLSNLAYLNHIKEEIQNNMNPHKTVPDQVANQFKRRTNDEIFFSNKKHKNNPQLAIEPIKPQEQANQNKRQINAFF